MKRLFFLVLFSNTIIKLIAQPVISSSILPVIGDTIKVGVDTLLVSPGPAGALVNWDFKNLPLHYSSSRIYLAPAATSYASFAPAATIVRTDPAGTFYSFWKNNTSVSTYYGFIEFNKYDQSYNSLPIGYYKFPLTYLKTYVDSFSATTNPGAVVGAGKYYFSADAWGTLILPHKTVSNTLRTKSVLYIGDSAVNNYSLTVDYAWYLEGKKDPLLVISSVVVNHALYKKFAIYDNAVGTGIQVVNNMKAINLYPNPASNQLVVLNSNLAQHTDYVIYSMQGDMMMQGELLEGQTTLDISKLSPGVYLFKTATDVQKFTIQK